MRSSAVIPGPPPLHRRRSPVARADARPLVVRWSASFGVPDAGGGGYMRGFAPDGPRRGTKSCNRSISRCFISVHGREVHHISGPAHARNDESGVESPVGLTGTPDQHRDPASRAPHREAPVHSTDGCGAPMSPRRRGATRERPSCAIEAARQTATSASSRAAGARTHCGRA